MGAHKVLTEGAHGSDLHPHILMFFIMTLRCSDSLQLGHWAARLSPVVYDHTISVVCEEETLETSEENHKYVRLLSNPRVKAAVIDESGTSGETSQNKTNVVEEHDCIETLLTHCQ